MLSETQCSVLNYERTTTRESNDENYISASFSFKDLLARNWLSFLDFRAAISVVCYPPVLRRNLNIVKTAGLVFNLGFIVISTSIQGTKSCYIKKTHNRRRKALSPKVKAFQLSFITKRTKNLKLRRGKHVIKNAYISIH